MKFGIRNVTDVTFKATSNRQKLGQTSFNKYDPILFLNSGKISTLESSVSTVYAQGGRGNPRILGWDGDRVVTLSFEDALMSPRSITALSGAGLLSNSNIQLHLTEKVAVLNATDYVLDFNGSTDYARADNEITAYPFTFETWVKFDGVGTGQSMMSLSSAVNASRYWTIGLTSTKLSMTARNTTINTVSGTTTIVADTWYHIAGVYASATDRRLYLNGVLEASDTSSVTFLASSANQILLGTFRTSSITAVLNGQLSDARVWNTARTVTEILDNYEQRLTGNEFNTFNQSVVNGNFASGTAGWTAVNGTFSVASKIGSLTGDGSAAESRIQYSNAITVPSSNKKFIKARVRVTNSVCTGIYVRLGGGTQMQQVQLSPVINQYYDFYFVGTGNTDNFIRIYQTYADAATANGKILEVDGDTGVFAIAMTGTPYENFTADEMNAAIGSYWEGSKDYGLMGYWKLEEGYSDILFDSTSNQNNGVPINIPTTWIEDSTVPLKGAAAHIDNIKGNVTLLSSAAIKVMTLDNFDSVTELSSFSIATNTTSGPLTTQLSLYGIPTTPVLVDFYCEQIGSRIIIEPETFSGYYYIEANTTFLGADGIEHNAQFTIPKAKIRSNFTFNISPYGEPSTFDFVIDAFPGKTRFNSLKKVLFVLEIGEGPAVGFNPRDINSLQLWLDATEISAADSTSVATWNDLSGNNFNATQTTSANQPTYRTNQVNGLPTIQFDGSNDFLSLSGGALSILRNVAGATTFVVYKASTALTIQVPIYFTKAIAGQTRFQVRKGATNTFNILAGRLDAEAVEFVTSTGTVNVGNYVLQSARIDYQNTLLQQFFKNTLDGQKTDFLTSGNTSDTDSNDATLGNANSASYLNGNIAEIIVYNRTLSTAELTQVNTYLMAKWRI